MAEQRNNNNGVLSFCANCGNVLPETCNFCTVCGFAVAVQMIEEPARLENVSSNVDPRQEEEEIIRLYFYCGYKYEHILALLSKYHHIDISMSTSKRRLKGYGLGRGRNDMSQGRLEELIRGQLDGAGRRLHRREYSSLGPNYAWHADGYDKLKDFGFPIHGCVDGYSRKILWLELTRSNNNPTIIAGFYLDWVKEAGGCPVILSTDPGSENCVMGAIQVSRRSKCADEFSGEKSHRFVESKRNQRIEAWWSFFRRNYSSWWINVFNDLAQRGLFLSGNELHRECLWFCFSCFVKRFGFCSSTLEHTSHTQITI
eukprot:gene11566-12762_t